MGGAALPIWACPRPKILWVVNPTHEWVKPPKLRQNPRYGPSPCVCGIYGGSVNSQYLHCQQMIIHVTWILKLLRKGIYLVQRTFEQEFDFMVIFVGPCTFQKLR